MKTFRSLLIYPILSTALIGSHAVAQSPYSQSDDTFITISGTVEEVFNDAFNLNYGDGVIRVEMDDGDRDADAYKLLYGDEVKVAGKIDNDFYQQTKGVSG